MSTWPRGKAQVLTKSPLLGSACTLDHRHLLELVGTDVPPERPADPVSVHSFGTDDDLRNIPALDPIHRLEVVGDAPLEVAEFGHFRLAPNALVVALRRERVVDVHRVRSGERVSPLHVFAHQPKTSVGGELGVSDHHEVPRDLVVVAGKHPLDEVGVQESVAILAAAAVRVHDELLAAVQLWARRPCDDAPWK